MALVTGCTVATATPAFTAAVTPADAAATLTVGARFDVAMAATGTALHLTAVAPTGTLPPTGTPVVAGTVAPSSTAAPTTPAPATQAPPPPGSSTATASGACTPRTDWPTYTVKPGDTLTWLAALTQSSVDALVLANCLPDTHLVAGQLLRVPQLPATVTPTAAASPQAPLAIYSFSVSPQDVSLNDNLMVTWNTNGFKAKLVQTVAQAVGPFAFDDLPPSGTRLVPFYGGHWNDFVLYAYTGDLATVVTSTVVSVRQHCPAPWYFQMTTRLCPNGPAETIAAVEQEFENGWMLWLDHLPANSMLSGPTHTRLIFVFYNADWSMVPYADTWDASQHDSDPTLTPPAGRVQPVRGFGLVWRSQPGVRAKLGWALAAEQSFNTQYQEVSGYDWNQGCTYLQRIDGKVAGTCRRSPGWFFATP